jgi:hypothetical protein
MEVPMIEDELREVFARREELAPEAGPVAEAAEADYRRRRRQRLGLRAAAAAAAVAAVIAVPAVVVALHRPAGGPSASALARGTATASALTTDAARPAGRPVTLVVALMSGATGGPPVAVGIAHVPASHDRAYLIALTGDDAAAVGNAFHDGKVGPLSAEVAQAAGVTVDGIVLVTTAGLSTVVSSLGGIDACPPGGGCQHLTGDSWLPYLQGNAATGGFASVGTGVLKGLAAITDPARLSQVLHGSGSVTLSLSADLPSPGDLSEALAGIRTAAGIVEPAGADRTELFRDLAADRLDAYLAAHPG